MISWSPWRTTSWYCLFLSSGRFVSMTPLPETRSIVQGIRPAAMNLARSLRSGKEKGQFLCDTVCLDEGGFNLPVEEVDSDTKVVSHAVEADDAVALQELLVGAQAHLPDEPVLVLVEVAVLGEELLLD